VQENLVLSWKFAELRDSPYKRNWTVTGQAAILLKHESQLAFLVCSLFATLAHAEGDLVLWYQKPAHEPMDRGAARWEWPLGWTDPRRAGEGADYCHEDSLWTGDENPSGNDDTMGAYQVLGELLIQVPAQTETTSYRRDLDISHALSHVTYQAGGVNYQREFFCSRPRRSLWRILPQTNRLLHWIDWIARWPWRNCNG